MYPKHVGYREIILSMCVRSAFRDLTSWYQSQRFEWTTGVMGVVSGATQCVLKVENIYTELRDEYQKAPEEID